MATRDKAAGSTTTIRTLSNTTAWVGGVVPVAGDDARWISTSSSGSHTGSITCDRIIVEGATGDITHAAGTVTFSSTGVFYQNVTDSARRFTVAGGTWALGGANRDCRIYTSVGNYTLQLFSANAITGTAASVINVINHLGTGLANNAYIVVGDTQSGFLGTVRLTAGSGIFTEAGSSATSGFNAATIICDGAGWLIGPAFSSNWIGGSGRTMTINQDGRIGWPSRNMTALSNVQLAGTGTRTLEVLGNTTLSGTVTGSAGVTATIQNSTGRVGGAGSQYLYLTGSSSGLTGACTVSGGRFVVGPSTTAARYVPTSINVASDASFEYFSMSSTDFTFPCAPTGTGFIAILGNHTAGGGITFSAGQLASFGGIVRSTPSTDAGYQASRIRLNELPGGLDWLANPNANSTMTGEFTYTGGAATYATNLTLDTYSNTSVAGLNAGTYSLIVPNTAGAIVITGTVQRLNTAGTTSGRMSLTLGGSNTGDNTLSGNISETASPLNGAILGITKVDAGRWVLSGANSSHTGIHTISAGTLSAQSAKALGAATSAGGVTVSGTGTLELSGGITLDKSSTPFTIHQTSPIVSVGDNTLQTAGVTLGGTTTFEVTTGNRLAISNTGAITDGASTFGITKTGAGELALAAYANTYDGTVTVTAGTLAIGSMGSLGTGNVALTGTLKYTGTGETISRTTQLVGSTASLEAAGSGAVTFSNLTQDTNAKTLTLKGSSTGANTVSTALANNTGALSLAKSDAGKWVLTGALSYTGTTAVNGGTLRVQTANSNTMASTVTIGASGTVELVTDTLASASSSSGEVLGTGNVTVNGGTIKTRGGTTQKGQARYGGNLTFGSGSTLYIGAAA